MSDLFDELFGSDYLFDNEYKQRQDINRVAAQLQAESTSLAGGVGQLKQQVAQLQLVNRGVAWLLEKKGIATREEIQVAIQQIDLLDGVEDGRVGAVYEGAPRCHRCTRFVNPARTHCLYCNASLQQVSDGPYRSGAPSDAQPAVGNSRSAPCGACGGVFAQDELYFTDAGTLTCSGCRG